MKDFKMLATLGMIPFQESRIIYVGEGCEADNIKEDVRVEMSRLRYASTLVRLGIDIDSDEGIRLIGKQL